MADIRKRTGSKGTTYQVRYPTTGAMSGYGYATFNTLKEARAFREDGSARKRGAPDRSVRTVVQAVDLWLDICEKEGTDGNEPVTNYTLKTYKYLAQFMKSHSWPKPLAELTPPDIVQFRSWLVGHCPSRYVARRTLSYFHTVLSEMALRGHVSSNVASGITINSNSRYDQPATPPSLEEFRALLTAADRLANSKNKQIAKPRKHAFEELVLTTASRARCHVAVGPLLAVNMDLAKDAKPCGAFDLAAIESLDDLGLPRFLNLVRDLLDEHARRTVAERSIGRRVRLIGVGDQTPIHVIGHRCSFENKTRRFGFVLRVSTGT